MHYYKLHKHFLLLIFCLPSINIHANYFEKMVNALSEKTAIAPETLKQSIIASLILGTAASLIGGAIYLDNYYNKQRQLAEDNLSDDEIINQEKLVLEKCKNIYAIHFNNFSDIEKLKENILKISSFPCFLRFKSKVINDITSCYRSINRIEYRLDPSFKGNTNNRNIPGLEELKHNFELLIADLCTLRSLVNDCIRSTCIENIMLSYIINRTYATQGKEISYYFAYLAEDLL